MVLTRWISLVSALVCLFVAILAISNARRSPLAAPLGRMMATLFAYEALEVLKHLVFRDELFYLECAAAALLPPTAAALVIAFIGSARRLRWLVRTGAVYFGAIALLCAAATVVPDLAWLPGSPTWAGALLAGMLPTFGYLAYRLYHHARHAGGHEATRTQVMVLALVLGAGGASSDLWAIAGLEVPRLAPFGLVASALCLAALSLRYELLERLETLATVYAAAIGSVVLFVHLFLLQWLGEQPTLLALLMVAVTLATVATVRPLLAARSEERARTGYLVTLGRLSAQMAHDLKNPLAAIRGAAQFLVEERKRGRSLDDHAAFVELIVEQTDRLERVVREYQRLGRAEARPVPVDVRSLLEEVAHAQRVASPAHRIEVEVDASLGTRGLDRDLLLGALENLMRNAREAIPKGGRIVLGARDVGGATEIWVEDDGPGMDARTRERAFDDFFTTKVGGSGLGLAFVSRVAAAHGGRARAEDVEPHGTRIRMVLRSQPAPEVTSA